MSDVFDASEVRLASILDTAVDGIIVIDSSARVIMYSAACERLFGYSQSEVIGQNVKMIMPASYAHEHDQYMTNYLTTGKRKIIGIGREVKAQHKDGTVFPIELSVGEAQLPDSRQFVGILRDLRPRMDAQMRMNELQNQLVHMSRLSAMDEMGATLAHELNQPLTAIMLYLEALKRIAERSDAAVPGLSKIVEKATHAADRAGSIINRLRHFVERREIERTVVDLRTVVDDAVDLASLGTRSIGIEVKIVPVQHPVTSLVDPIQIQQILLNLVRNSVDAIKEYGRGDLVEIDFGMDEKRVMVYVQDNGPGIDPVVRDELFKAFATTKPDGLGIGLAISQSIAQNHGGTLSVDDRAGGSGARFTLDLPKH